MLSFLDAVSAPLRMRSQNESQGTSWVIMATVARGVSTVPPPPPPFDSWGLPPVLEHDAIPTTSTLTPASAASRLNLTFGLLFARALIANSTLLFESRRDTPSRLDVIRLTLESQYFVRTLG